MPINEHELGAPITVKSSQSFSNYWIDGWQNKVDWLHGNVETVTSAAIPFTGIGFGKGTHVAFPSLTKFAWLPHLKDIRN